MSKRTYTHAVLLHYYNTETKQSEATVLSRHTSHEAARKAFHREAKMGRSVSFVSSDAPARRYP